MKKLNFRLVATKDPCVDVGREKFDTSFFKTATREDNSVLKLGFPVKCDFCDHFWGFSVLWKCDSSSHKCCGSILPGQQITFVLS